MQKNDTPNELRKRKWGDRKDGHLLRDLDPLHIIMPYMYPNRCDNEAFIKEKIDVSNIRKYLKKRNKDNPEASYTLFHIMVAAVAKTITLRPKMNRFVQGQKMYERNEVSTAFVIKKGIEDDGEESIAYLVHPESDTLDSIRDRINKEIRTAQEEDLTGAMSSLSVILKTPRWLLKIVTAFLGWLDFHGWMPLFVTETDPSYSSVWLSSLGSIKLNAAYHHLTQRGTNSVFLVIGETHRHPFFDHDGNVTMKAVIDIGLTIDERIADGYYYSKTIKLLKYLLQNPELLEKPIGEKVTYS